jgi:hypothetical protein
MPRILAVALALVLVLPPCHGQNSSAHKPATRTRTKSTAKSKKAGAKIKQAKAAAQLEKAKNLLNADKRAEAIKRLWKIVRRYPRTRAALEALIVLRFAPP